MGPFSVFIADVDGVQTPRTLHYDGQHVSKTFHVGDGYAWVQMRKMGVRCLWLTGRDDAATHQRAAELGIQVLVSGADKWLTLCESEFFHASWAPMSIYIGDDLPDCQVMQHVGWGVAVSDAYPEVRAVADWITPSNGGFGAIRDTYDHLMANQQLVQHRG